MTRLFKTIFIFISSIIFILGFSLNAMSSTAIYKCQTDKKGRSGFQFKFNINKISNNSFESRIKYKSWVNGKNAERRLKGVYDGSILKLSSEYYLEGKKLNYPITFSYSRS